MSNGANTMDLEAALVALPPAIEEAVRVTGPAAQNAVQVMRDTAKEVGAQVLIKETETACLAIESIVSLYKELIGEEGDSVTTGSAYGLLASCKKQDAVLNGNG